MDSNEKIIKKNKTNNDRQFHVRKMYHNDNLFLLGPSKKVQKSTDQNIINTFKLQKNNNILVFMHISKKTILITMKYYVNNDNNVYRDDHF